jgi:hypothetical protein
LIADTSDLACNREHTHMATATAPSTIGASGRSPAVIPSYLVEDVQPTVAEGPAALGRAGPRTAKQTGHQPAVSGDVAALTPFLPPTQKATMHQWLWLIVMQCIGAAILCAAINFGIHAAVYANSKVREDRVACSSTAPARARTPRQSYPSCLVSTYVSTCSPSTYSSSRTLSRAILR